MGIGKNAAEAVLTAAKDKDVQKATSGVMGMLFPYFGLKKKAVDTYIDEIKKSELSPDAKFAAILTLKDKAKKIKNQSAVAEKTIQSAKNGTVFSEDSKVNEEWFDRFMDSAGYVSDEMMQDIWGQILAKEFDVPGSTPPNMTRILTEITATQAQAFRKICCMQGLIIEINEKNNTNEQIAIQKVTNEIMIPYTGDKYLQKQGVTLGLINEMESIGLLHFHPLVPYIKTGFKERIVLCFDNSKTIQVEKYRNYDGFPFGNIMLTAAGECLRRITPIESMDGYSDAMLSFLERNGVQFSEKSNYCVSYNRIGDDIDYHIVRLENI